MNATERAVWSALLPNPNAAEAAVDYATIVYVVTTKNASMVVGSP